MQQYHFIVHEYTKINNDNQQTFIFLLFFFFTVFSTVSRQTSYESETSLSSSTPRKKKKKTTPSAKSAPSGSNTIGPYTEYYPNRAQSCYAGLQPVASDSALSAMEKSYPPAGNSFLVSEYQEPDPVVPFIPVMNDDTRLSNSNSVTSFKLPGEYAQPAVPRHSIDKTSLGSPGRGRTPDGGSGGISPDSTIAKHFKQKGDDNTTSPTSSVWHGFKKGKRKKGESSASCKLSSASCKETTSNTRPDSKEGNFYLELQEKLNRKRKSAEGAEVAQADIDGENPYAEVGDALLEPYPDMRPRSHSQPTSTLPGYRTYEEIKPIAQPDLIGNTILDYDDSDCKGNNPYFVLEKPDPTYFELENENDASSSRNKLEKPTSLPLDKTKKHFLSESGKYSPEQKTATLYQNDKCASKANGLKNQQFDLCVDSDKDNKSCPNGYTAKAPVYFELEMSNHRASSGSKIEEYMDSTEMEIPNDPTSLAEGTLTFYPGGRQRASVHSVEEQAYDHLNRSARSSRASSRKSTANNENVSGNSDSAYGSLTPSEEHSQQTRISNSKTKSFRKK